MYIYFKYVNMYFRYVIQGDSEQPPAAEESARSKVRHRPGEYNRLDEDD